MHQGILDGIRVIDMATFIFGPACSMVMSDFGASVVKVESPGLGDPYRHLHLVPPFEKKDVDYFFQLDNRNKRSVVLDARIDSAREALLELVRQCDVFVTNFPPRVLEKFRTRYEDLAPENPRLIYAQVTGYGEKGEEIDKPGFDATAYWARTGLMDGVRADGAEPALSNPGMGDHPSAMSLFGGIMLALYRRERTGEGTKVSSSLLANGAWSNACAISSILAGCEQLDPIPRKSPPNALLNQYKTRDGRFFVLVVLQPERFGRLADAVGRPELAHDPRFADRDSILRNTAELAQILDGVFSSRDFEEWRKILDDAGITFGAVGRTDEAVLDSQMIENDLFIEVAHEDAPGTRVVDSPIWLAGEPKQTSRRAPRLGEHTDQVLAELGYSTEKIAALRDEGALG